MLWSGLPTKSSKVCTITQSTVASLLLKGLSFKQRTVKKNELSLNRSDEEIPLTNRVRGPYWKLRTEFFPFDLWPKREARGP